MSVLFYSSDDTGNSTETRLRQALEESLPGMSLESWPQKTGSENIDFAVVWNPPANFFDDLLHLKAIFSLGAGVDHLLKHPRLPEGVPLVRVLDAGMGEKMAEYVLYGVLGAHRQMQQYKICQQQAIWSEELPSPPAADLTVGILGIGTLGQCIATRLMLNGYTVQGWSRSAKSIPDLSTFHGNAGLDQLLKNSDILVCVLPLTEQTSGILDSALFARAKRGVYLINVARGGHLVQGDLLSALETGQVSGALLDVINPEPPGNDHPFWRHPLINITPHISAPTQTGPTVQQIVDNLRRITDGQSMQGVVDRQSSY